MQELTLIDKGYWYEHKETGALFAQVCICCHKAISYEPDSDIMCDNCVDEFIRAHGGYPKEAPVT